MSMSRRTFTTALAGLGSLAAAPVSAQIRFPERSVRLLVPFSPGGNADVLARNMAQRLGDAWGTQVVVDNRAGGGGALAIDATAHAAPDGYTALFHSSGIGLEPYVRKSVNYDVLRDLAPVARISESALAISVHPSLQVRSIAELLAYARANPGRINYGSGGYGSIIHLGTELFCLQGKVQMTHVPYRGSGPALVALTTNEIQLMVDTLSTTRPLAEDGRVRVLAVTTAERWASWPELPTVRESGLPGFDFSIWHGFFAPARTPAPLIRQWSDAVGAVLAKPETQAWADRLGFRVVHYGPEEFGRFVRSEVDKWKDVVAHVGLEPQ